MVTRARWRALGTTAELLVLGDAAQLARARLAVEESLRHVDLACSRFRADSELTRLNEADGAPQPASALLLEAVELALRAARSTDGDVDPTLGRALEAAGYDCDWELIADEDEDLASLEPREPLGPLGPPGPLPVRARVRVRGRRRWSAIRVDRAGATIQLPRGVKLDLGATAKAWAADRAVATAAAAAGCGALVNLGGDLAATGPSPLRGWSVHVTDDHRDGPDAPGQTVTIRTGGLATSSTTVRRWRRDGRQMHHIIDPATQAPSHSPWRTVSVAAASCADANIAATAAIVRGHGAPRWLAELGLPARLVGHDGSVVAVAGWPHERQELDVRLQVAAA